jgi:SNF2 family DNA or RNA helicase
VLKDLPSKARRTEYVEVSDNFLVEYETAKDNVIAYLREIAGKDTTMSEKAQVLVRLNVLRRIAGRSKIAPTIQWVSDFLDETERSVVVFASHIEVQDSIYDALSDAGVAVARIHGKDSDAVVEAEKARFQSGEARVIVCSLRKGGTGHTLTAASDVLIVEQDWTPANLNQAEDRVHRIGQEEAVTAVHLVADLGIDYHLRRVVEAKQEVFDAVAQGQDTDTNVIDSSVVDELVKAMLAAEEQTVDKAAREQQDGEGK